MKIDVHSHIFEDDPAIRALFARFPDRILYGVDAGWMPHRRDTPPSAAQRQDHANAERIFQLAAAWRRIP